jgi:hypothetical protein
MKLPSANPPNADNHRDLIFRSLNLEENSMQTLIDDVKLKQLLKEALAEAIEEKRNLFYDLIVDAVEDIAIVRAIQEGENTETVSKQEIFNILEDQA